MPIAAIVVSGVLAVVLTLNAIAPPGGNWRERALAFADLQHMFGPMQVAGQSYSGSFVKFRFNEATATITDYTVIARGRTTAVFQDMVPGIVSFGSVILNGTLFEYSSAAYIILSFNNPTSTLIVESVSATM